MDQQNNSAQNSALVVPDSSTEPIPPTPNPSGNQKVTSDQRSVVAATEISFAGVDSSVWVYVLKYSWVLIIGVIVAIAVAVFGHTFIGVFIPFIIATVLKTKYENNLFSAFAKANKYSYSKNGSPTASLDGLIFSIGHSQKVTDVVSGRYMNRAFNLFVYNYTIGYGRDKERYARAVMHVAFDTTLPAFVLRQHKSLAQALDGEGESLKNFGYTEKISLEGDFDQHFSVHIRLNTQDDVLSVLTPDVMELLIGLDRYEIEMTAAGNFYIYARKFINKVESLADMYKIVEEITKPIGLYAGVQRGLHRQQVITPTVAATTQVPGNVRPVTTNRVNFSFKIGRLR